ncbi:hypothetical protein OQA88_3770 [Cercophora sp. LCS_1]
MEYSSPRRPRNPPSTSLAGTPHNLRFSDYDDDQLSVISQSPYFETQPTQILERPTLNPQPAAIASSPNSRIEVPVSSPCRPLSELQKSSRLANSMAPAGTSFKPPPTVELTRGPKKPVIEIPDSPPQYSLSSDSEDDQPARGDIKPSSFGPKEPKQVIDLTDDTSSITAAPSKKYVPLDDWVSKEVSRTLNRDSLSVSPEKPAPKPRRRLVQGRRPRQPSTSPVQTIKTKAPEPTIPKKRPIFVLSDDDSDDNNDNDSDDDYQNQKPSARDRDSSPEMQDDSISQNDQILRFLNDCTAIQLVAATSVKMDQAEAMISHQPFDSIDAAMNVTMSQKKQRKKAARVSVGETVVAALQEYVRALNGIDHIMAVCESKADFIKKATSRWAMDMTGQPRTDESDKPLTPRSIDGSTKMIGLPLQQPKVMTGCTMKSFQIYGLNWLYLLYEKQFGAILADDMGLGKTCQVISLICSVIERAAGTDVEPWPNVIIVPPSTLANWKAEFERFAPGLNVTVYQGSQAKRDEIADEIIDDLSAHHVVLTSYSQVSRPEDISNLRRFKPTVAVFDEGHKLKNPKTKLYKDLLRITADWRLILSGTPVQNNLMEMVSLLRFVEPELFDGEHFEDLEALFNQKVSLTAVSQGAMLHSDRVTRARSILEPFILQRKKEQVLKDMPAKTARVVYCNMDEAQETIYRDYERRFKRNDSSQVPVSKKEGRENDNNNVWIQLRKAAIHPQLFRRHYADKIVEKMAKVLMRSVPQTELRQTNIKHLEDEIKALSDFEIHLWCRDYKCIRSYDLPDGSWMKNAKVKALLDLLAQYKANGDRALVFTRYAKVIELLGESLASSGIEYLSLQGNTDVSERQELINQFNSDASIPVFLLTTGSGGTGINLTSANKVIIFDQSDNPQEDIQAENRAHRLGQTKPVEIIRLISRDSVEELVYKACQKKLELANRVTGWAVDMDAGEMEAAVRDALLNGASLASPPGES